MSETTELWRHHARQWQRVGQPLRPTGHDTAVMATIVRQWCDEQACLHPRALMLGVTPEIASMDWPRGTRLTACDRSLAMIKAIWPGDNTFRRVVCADWFALPFAARSFDLIVGDGALNALPRAEFYPHILKTLAAQMDLNGRLVLRLFVSPARKESTADVWAAAWAGEIGNFHILKWRLAMSVQRDFASGAKLADVWAAWAAAGAKVGDIARLFQCSVDTVRTIDAYRGSDTRFTFPSLVELRAMLAPSFRELRCHLPTFEMGERCPTFELVPRAGNGV